MCPARPFPCCSGPLPPSGGLPGSAADGAPRLGPGLPLRRPLPLPEGAHGHDARTAERLLPGQLRVRDAAVTRLRHQLRGRDRNIVTLSTRGTGGLTWFVSCCVLSGMASACLDVVSGSQAGLIKLPSG